MSTSVWSPEEEARRRRIIREGHAALRDRIYELLDPEHQGARGWHGGKATAPPLPPQDALLRDAIRDETRPLIAALEEYVAAQTWLPPFLTDEQRGRWVAWCISNPEKVKGIALAGTIRRHIREGRCPRGRTVEKAWEEIHGAGYEFALLEMLNGADEDLPSAEPGGVAA